ncbi:hypothetical protein NPIL_347351 [Nephila pilipes]|uniref:RRM domain-containing protein n=1 Tax=Nephila pilipes TaxID=299642 RepID=A0A8X6P9J0_NEPPI|nr:hypothetical protein NPIL_347351 [Nephila pilipes]
MLNLNNPAFTKTDKKLLKHSVSNGPMETSDQQVKRTKKMKPKKRKRIIIRNLSFKVEEDDLKELFSNYGKILDVKIPLKGLKYFYYI